MTRVLDLFSGIGGFSLAFERQGFQTVAFAEVEPFPCAVLAHHWPDVPNLGDVQAIDGRDIRADVVTFGSPCQDLSIAGNRAGLDGERSGLFHEAIRIIRDVRPAFAVFENVPGIFSSDGGRDFGAVLDALADAGAVDIAWRVLDAQWFGVPQRRRRVFVVADFGGERAGEILFEPESVRGNPAARGAARQSVAGTLGRGFGDRRVDVQADYVVAPTLESGGNRTGGTRPPGTTVDTADSLIADCLTARDSKGADSNTKRGHLIAFASETGQGWWSEREPCLRAENTTSKPNCILAVAQPLRAGRQYSDMGDGQSNVVATGFYPTDGRFDNFPPEGLAPPVKCGSSTGGNPPGVAIAAGVRRLTPVECERLQGFPDGWTDVPYRCKPAADGPRYRALGNSVAVPVVEWIARRMAAALANADMRATA